jgi:hypothetical protein
MERAALFRLGSAVAGCVVNCVAAAAGGSDFTKSCCRSLAEAFNKINPLDLAASGQDLRSKRMDLAAGESAEGVRTGDDWFASARELERRLFDRLEQIQRSDHELNAELLGHLGEG